MSTSDRPVLDVRDLHVSYSQGDSRTVIVHGVSFTVQPGEVVALVGESGSGKTSTAQAVIGLLAENGRIDSGAILLNGEDISCWNAKRLRAIRGAVVSLVPQDPGSSLNPVLTIGAQVREILEIHGRLNRREADRKVIELLTNVGLSEPELRVRQYPHELSGGMKQRVLIAIAIALRPALIIADEPTSALDVTVQRRILDLIDDLRRGYGTAVLLVTHDLGVAADRSDKIIVLQGGHIQEQGKTADVLAAPQSAYTRKLLSDAPSLSVAKPRPAVEPDRPVALTISNLVQDFELPTGSQFRPWTTSRLPLRAAPPMQSSADPAQARRRPSVRLPDFKSQRAEISASGILMSEAFARKVFASSAAKYSSSIRTLGHRLIRDRRFRPLLRNRYSTSMLFLATSARHACAPS